MREVDLISVLAEGWARSPEQENARFTSDAEIMTIDGLRLAITVDDYSGEDRFGADDPNRLGWNLITATVSDLLAVGAVPRFMLNSFVATRAMNQTYLRALAEGMRDALAACGASMAGGDIGTGDEWRFTGVAVGTFRAGQAPANRLAPCNAGAIMVSGEFGDANLAAAAGGPAPRFEMRVIESAHLASIEPQSAGGRAIGCIDTSDGLISALGTFAALTKNLRIEIDSTKVPYAAGVERAAQSLKIPPEAFVMGSAGEYELVALVPERAVARAGDAGLRRIGSFGRDKTPGVFFCREDAVIACPDLPDPRECESFDAYCTNLIALARNSFGREVSV